MINEINYVWTLNSDQAKNFAEAENEETILHFGGQWNQLYLTFKQLLKPQLQHNEPFSISIWCFLFHICC